MKFYTVDKTVLMDVTGVKQSNDGIVLEGKIMGTMPMKAVLTATELRAGLRFLSAALVWRSLRMLALGR
jgi:hypothetical protein